MTNRLYHIHDILSLYKFPFFTDSSHLNFLEQQYILHGHALCEATRLFLPESVTDIPDIKILEHLTRRIPVYFGKAKTDMFDWKRVKEVLNYDYRDLQTNTELVSNIRYAIAGPINIMPYKNLSERKAWVIHLWGVNFESTETDDYQVLYRNSGELDIEKYFDRQLDIFKMILKSAFYAKEKENAEQVKIQMPMIGLGQFLKALTEPEQQACQLLFFEALSEILKQYETYTNFIIKLCIFSPHEFKSEYLRKLENLANQYSQLIIGLSNKDGNILENIDNNDNDDNNKDNNNNNKNKNNKTLTCIVNAWDTRSFIGNGGSQDLTVDGFIVANAGNYNNQCRNTSYLHNSFFCPNVLYANKWIIVT